MRICPGCRAEYDESVHTCARDGLPLLEVSRTFTDLKEGEQPAPTEEDAEGQPEQVVRPRMKIGEYLVEGTIAKGGMGAIYAGIHPVISKRVAIKVISKRFAKDPKAVARFVLEAKSVNQIGHHNIVDIFSIGVLDDGRNFLIMELLDGLGLHHVLAKLKRLRPGEVVPIYEQACDALEAAHNKGFIHRDLKPDNIVVLRRPPYPFIKILDFGLAKLRGSAVSHNTEVGTVLGTPEYMAPEQCRGAPVDARTDVYAMGVMLYELVTGRKPFTDPSPLRILAMQQRNAPLSPSRIAPIPKMLELVILKAMAKDPAERQPSARALLGELQRAVPDPLSWTAAHLDAVSKDEWLQRAAPPEETEGPRAQVSIPGRVEALQPVTISGEVPPLSDEMEAAAVEDEDQHGDEGKDNYNYKDKDRNQDRNQDRNEDDSVQTMVSDRHLDAPPQPEPPVPISGEMSAHEVEDEATTEVDPVETDRPASPAAHRPLDPAPGFVRPPYSGRPDTAVDSRVDDQAPAVLVDRPIHDVGGSTISDIVRRPQLLPDSARDELDAQRTPVSEFMLPPPARVPDGLTTARATAARAGAGSSSMLDGGAASAPDSFAAAMRAATPAEGARIPVSSRSPSINDPDEIAMGKTIPLTSASAPAPAVSPEPRERRRTGPPPQELSTGRPRRSTGPRPIDRFAGSARREPARAPAPRPRVPSWSRLIALVLAVVVAAIAVLLIIRRF